MLVILHDRAYGDERANNGLRLAGILAKRDGVEVKAFCSGDAVGCAVAGQQVLNGYYHLDRMIPSAARHGRGIGLCGSCMDARGIDDAMVIDDVHRSSLDEVTDWTLWAGPTGFLGRKREDPKRSQPRGQSTDVRSVTAPRTCCAWALPAQ